MSQIFKRGTEFRVNVPASHHYIIPKKKHLVLMTSYSGNFLYLGNYRTFKNVEIYRLSKSFDLELHNVSRDIRYIGNTKKCLPRRPYQLESCIYKFYLGSKYYVIYLASCKKCNLQYIRSTTTDFGVRFRNHKSALVTKKKTSEVAVHFNRTPHDLNDFSFQCIDQVQITANNSSNIEKLLITKEAYWSAQLFSLALFGFNKRQEFHSKKRINYNKRKNNLKIRRLS